MEQVRKIIQNIQGKPTSDGAGVRLKRTLGNPELNQLDPFLLLDEFKNKNPDDYAAGFPNHPHRGFETVTYLMTGSFPHWDSKGHEGHLTAGSVLWTTAGRGIIHSEMTGPKYQDLSSEKLPVVEANGIWVKILAGEYAGTRSPCHSFIPFTYLDVRLKASATLSLSASEN